MDILTKLNSLPLYLIVSLVIACVSILCIIFIIKSYRAGIHIGMEKSTLRRTIISSITFSIIPSISILLGVIALSGTLGIPLPWMRLSVVGALHYETTVAEIAAQSVGLSGLVASEMTTGAYVTIALLMGVGIMWGCLLCIVLLKKYLSKFSGRDTQKSDKPSKKSFGDAAMTAMFVGLCCAYICSYIGVLVKDTDYMPLVVALFSGIAMFILTYIKDKKKLIVIDNFSLAGSMLFGMAMAVVINLAVGGAL